MLSPARLAAPLLLSLSLATAACTAPVDSYPDPTPTTDTAVVTMSAPAAMLGTWESESGQGNSSWWTFDANGAATHTLVVVSGPDTCALTSTTTYTGSVSTSDRTLVFKADSSMIADVDCNGSTRSTGDAFTETLTFELASPTELVLHDVSQCSQTDQASKDLLCKTTFLRTAQ